MVVDKCPAVEVLLAELEAPEAAVPIAETSVRCGTKVGLKFKAVRGDEVVDAAAWRCSFCSARYCDIAEGDMNCIGTEGTKDDSCAVVLPDIGRFLGRGLLL